MILSNFRIIVRIGLVVGVILLMMLALMLVEMKALNDMKNSLNEAVSVHNEKLLLSQDMRFLARNNAVLVRNILLMDDPQGIEEELVKIADCEQKYREALIRLGSLETEAKGRKLLGSIKDGEAGTRALWRQVIDFGMSGNKKTGIAILIKAVRAQQLSWLGSLEDMVTLQKQQAVSAAGMATQRYEKIRRIIVIADCFAFLVSALLVVFLASSIVRPLHEFTRTVDSIAGGDLATRINLPQRDEIGTLGTHINNMAEQLQASEKELDQYRFHLEELIEERSIDLNEQRKRFISVLIHDLKGPLVPLIGFSRKLLGQKNASAEKTGEYARAIHEASMKLAATIDQVSKDLRGGRLDHCFDNEVFDVEELLRSVVQNFLPKAENEHLQIILTAPEPDAPTSETSAIKYVGDSAKIRTLMENLIGNAVKYARSRIRIALHKTDGFLELVVEDDGTGIEEKYLEKIFEEYFQAPQSKAGSGVGLYSAKRIVEHYNGKIWAEKSRHNGAKFFVRLPLLG